MGTVRVAGALIAMLVVTVFPSASVLAASDSVQIEGVTVTASDMQRLFGALNLALKPNDSTIPIAVSVKKPSEMPSYDPQYHYLGISQDAQGARQMQVWINGALSDKDSTNAIAAAFFLGSRTAATPGRPSRAYTIFSRKRTRSFPPTLRIRF